MPESRRHEPAQSPSPALIAEIEQEIDSGGRQVLPKLKGMYRAMVSARKGYWEPKARRTRDDFGDLSPTNLINEGIIDKKDRSRFQTWFLVDEAPWPNRAESKDDAKKLLRFMQRDSARWLQADGQDTAVGQKADRYYNALKDLLHCRDDLQQDLARQVAGVYTVYRPSLVYPGHYVKGLLGCFLDSATGALRTLEVHRAKSYGGVREAGAETFDTVPELEDILVGVMVQKGRLVHIHAVDLMTRSFNMVNLNTLLRGPAFPSTGTGTDTVGGEKPRTETRGSSRYIVLDDERAKGLRRSDGPADSHKADLVSPLAILSGVVCGTVGGRTFAYPCVYARHPRQPEKMPKRASELFNEFRSVEAYKSVSEVVSTVPAFILEQLRLCAPPVATLCPD